MGRWPSWSEPTSSSLQLVETRGSSSTYKELEVCLTQVPIDNVHVGIPEQPPTQRCDYILHHIVLSCMIFVDLIHVCTSVPFRPQILVLMKPDVNFLPSHPKLLSFASQLKAGTYVCIHVHTYSNMYVYVCAYVLL